MLRRIGGLVRHNKFANELIMKKDNLSKQRIKELEKFVDKITEHRDWSVETLDDLSDAVNTHLDLRDRLFEHAKIKMKELKKENIDLKSKLSEYENR